MIEIIPAIIPKNFEELEEKISQVKNQTDFIQIDIMDGSMSPSKSWPYIGPLQRNDFEKLKIEEEGLPFWQDVNFEIDLMVKEPLILAEEWVLAGAARIIFHIESNMDFQEFFEKRSNNTNDFLKTEIGLAIGIETPNEKLNPFLKQADFIQFMGIKNIGFQGEGFDKRVLEKIKNLRKVSPQTIISIDGGVSLDNAKELVETGVNRLVSGSAVFGSINPREAIENFKSLF